MQSYAFNYADYEGGCLIDNNCLMQYRRSIPREYQSDSIVAKRFIIARLYVHVELCAVIWNDMSVVGCRLSVVDSLVTLTMRNQVSRSRDELLPACVVA
jgi:hypothetical protein